MTERWRAEAEQIALEHLPEPSMYRVYLRDAILRLIKRVEQDTRQNLKVPHD